MHTLHCARNVALCPHCDEPFPRSQMEEHVREEHTDAECRECGAEVPRSRMGEHKVTTTIFVATGDYLILTCVASVGGKL